VATFNQLVGRLRLRHFSLLVALDEHRNLNRAAADVCIAQPSATKLLRDVESIFGFPLFERLSRGMAPTELGMDVIAFSRRVVRDLDRFASHLHNKRHGGRGHLIIGTMAGVAPNVLARATAAIKNRYPTLSVRLLETSNSVVELLLDYEIDLAVGRPANSAQHHAVHYEALGHEVPCIVARSGHPLSRVHPLTLLSLEHCLWVLPPIVDSARQIMEQVFDECHMKTPLNVIESSSIFETLQLLQESDAITMLTEAIVQRQVRAGLMNQLAVEIEGNILGFGVMIRRDEELTRAAEEFVGSLRQCATNLENTRIRVHSPGAYPRSDLEDPLEPTALF
jgi:DNA-binding transcriptional LysR family regulator